MAGAPGLGSEPSVPGQVVYVDDSKNVHEEPDEGSEVYDPPPREPGSDPYSKTAPYDVFDFYHAKGPISRVAKHKVFEYLTLLVIFFNAIWIGIDTDMNFSEDPMYADDVFKVMENFFCIYFSGEVIIRFMAFRIKLNCLRDGWFKFDSILVGMMVVETWVVPLAKDPEADSAAGGGQLSILRLLRLLRLTRMARLMRAMPELLTLIKGISAAARSVSCTLALLLVFLYIFAIIFTQTFADGQYPLEHPVVPNAYGSLTLSMFQLFMAGTLLDNVIDVMGDLEQNGPTIMVYLFILFILLSSFTVLNMLIGVLCEVVTQTSQTEAENAMVAQIREEITGVFREIDCNGDGTVSKDEFEQMKRNPIVISALDKVGVKPKHFFALSDVLFEPAEPPKETSKTKEELEKEQETMLEMSAEERQALSARRASQLTGTKIKATEKGTESVELEFDDFLEMVISQRPEKNASVMDTALLRQMFRTMIHRVDQRIEHFMTKLERLESRARVMTMAQHPHAVDPNDRSIDTAIAHAEKLIEHFDYQHGRSHGMVSGKQYGIMGERNHHDIPDLDKVQALAAASS